MTTLLSQGLAKAAHLNSNVTCEGQHYYITLSDGGKKLITKCMEGHKVAVGCTCEEEHVRFCTPNSIKTERDMLCQFCDHGREAWRLARKRTVAESEKAAMQALKMARLDKRVACEVSLPFWRGRVDFYDIPSKTAIQADGRSHYVKTHKQQPGQQLKLDMHCCLKAWEHSVRLLRLYHSATGDNTTWGPAMLAATELQASRFVMLSREYADILIDTAHNQTCIDWMSARLTGAQFRYDEAIQCYMWLTL